MIKNIRFIRTFTLTAISLFILVILLVIFNLPYYRGFEGGLDYLSSDLSESRLIIREDVKIREPSLIKIVFETKDSSIIYDREQFNDFIDGLEIRIWRKGEFYDFADFNDNIDFSSVRRNMEIPIGEIDGAGIYTVYIKSNYGRNASYHIGIGIGRESKLPSISNNIRMFF